VPEGVMRNARKFVVPQSTPIIAFLLLAAKEGSPQRHRDTKAWHFLRAFVSLWWNPK
jgi:hypothetical protein